jgi:hypothetical protein
MARTRLSLFGALATVVALAVPAQEAATAPVPPRDFVLGSGMSGIFQDIVIDARSDPLGGNPSGTVSFRVVIPPLEALVSGSVTCLAVGGDRAVIGFVDTTAGVGPVTVVVGDSGPAGSILDEFSASPQPTDCSTDPGLDGGPLSQGDILVRDAPSKAQCERGGWPNYTDIAGQPFKNQGSCIAFALGVA